MVKLVEIFYRVDDFCHLFILPAGVNYPNLIDILS
ncbi:hypothetical protein Xsto_01349 [Xenorhabdus stockiae]|uniref:Uncharacterized protein n=1 Tax=Xenorhabdus stockiae TaxID=351614 RepID=A0A2D0KRS4_9GAMM|nr:hypothetical protein Xsto_01349 [Xenorhabdus stockiae]